MAQEIVEAPLAGKIIRVHVKPGDKVSEGDLLCTIESLKMENSILAPISGAIKEVRIAPGQAIKAGEGMITIES
ncbi:MAG: acetyl-CoA carboxylase biotin carboxyl carrier protein subunit [Candidatus Bipolaricaulota bacterium]|nr:acetyl-CoA carboxylase biotin carboxyl carrier protein subunit [Candidatus Bipolaricaulota bacterium]MDW8140679.1 acetyl-CoA carboxylase biotin carboxyl carrier protein subunit [Candidatus Bipolaricaulota bacterium]